MEVVSKYMGHANVTTTAVNYWVPTTIELNDGIDRKQSAEVLLISKALLREDTTNLRLRAKKGEAAHS